MAAVVAFVEDLMFLSRIREAARGTGLDVSSVRRVEDLLAACRGGARLVLLDLDSRRLPGRDALTAVRAEAGLDQVVTVGFLGHEETEAAQAARDAGCTLVLARGVFVQRLPALLREAAQAPGGSATDSNSSG
jgi:CheY-like chemotaxis protein